ncbi:putative chitinase [Fibrella aestuarina BUZ 2]|uniref:Putative chitinase n=1 Tax=Fibrella aestuarina BUZ 2 TaxID=1166018 RepID=I0KD25_9BACT|nr:glycoside hydrolase family 19 protein [Fibrella aestuarina]CCH02028.1 putative chitinase [Fibrella aestuarina BUZ 2]
MVLSQTQLAQMCGSASRAALYADPINAALAEGKILSPTATAHFMAQVLHESWDLTRTYENLNYKPEAALATFNQNRIRITPAQAQLYCRTAAHKANQEAIANLVYAGMSGNGNVASGDGWRYRGRGGIQLTLKDNYAAAGKALGLNLVGQPDLAAQPDIWPRVAVWYWNSRGLTAIAETDKVGVVEDDDDVCLLIRRRVNGGKIGFTETLEKLALCKRVLHLN